MGTPLALIQSMGSMMNIDHANLSRLDLNLLVAFDALLVEGSVTRAAAKVGLGQSAMSHNLARLRRLFGDELFTRGPNGMRPTPRALALADPLRAALAQVQSAVLQREPSTQPRQNGHSASDLQTPLRLHSFPRSSSACRTRRLDYLCGYVRRIASASWRSWTREISTLASVCSIWARPITTAGRFIPTTSYACSAQNGSAWPHRFRCKTIAPSSCADQSGRRRQGRRGRGARKAQTPADHCHDNAGLSRRALRGPPGRGDYNHAVTARPAISRRPSRLPRAPSRSNCRVFPSRCFGMGASTRIPVMPSPLLSPKTASNSDAIGSRLGRVWTTPVFPPRVLCFAPSSAQARV